MPTSRKHALSDWGSDIDTRIRAAHVTKAALAQQLSLHPSTLFRWLQTAPPSEFERRRVENVLGQFEGVRPGTVPDRLMGYERDSVGDQLRSLVDDLRKSRRDLARALSKGKDSVPIHDAVYWLNRILAVTENTVAVRDGVIGLLGSLPIAVYHFGPDFTVRWNTAGTATLFGWTPEEIVRKGAMSFIHPDDLPHSTEALTELASRRTYEPFEVRIRCKDGSYKTVTARSIGVFGDDGKLRGIITALM
jgi:PAS domain S-box-containing protein